MNSKYLLILPCLLCCYVDARVAVQTKPTINHQYAKNDTNKKKSSEECKVVEQILTEGIKAVNSGSARVCITIFDRLFTEYVDWKFMCKQLFQRNNWFKLKSLNKLEIAQNSAKNMMIYQYVSGFLGKGEATFEVEQNVVRISNEMCNVFSKIISAQGEELAIVRWTLHRKDGKWLVINVKFKDLTKNTETDIIALQQAGVLGMIKKQGLEKFILQMEKFYGTLEKIVKMTEKVTH